MGSALLCLDGIVTHIRYLLKLYTDVDLMGQAIKSTQSSDPVIPFLLLARGRDSLFLFLVRVFG